MNDHKMVCAWIGGIFVALYWLWVIVSGIDDAIDWLRHETGRLDRD